jgi:creatinine amidohydrolase
MRMIDLSWTEIAEYLARDDRVILPLGATEEHGPHLGLGTDSLEAEAIAVEAGEMAGIPVCPTLDYGMSAAMMNFPGTISLRPATLVLVLEDILRALHRHGFRRILIVNGHGGNTGSISSALHTVADELPGLRVKNFQWWTDPESYEVVTRTMGPQTGSHASCGETAFMMAIRTQGVKMDRLTGRNAPVSPTREIICAPDFGAHFPDGIMGDHPSTAYPEAGRQILEASAAICVRELADW